MSAESTASYSLLVVTPLRLMIHDRTCPKLGLVWRAGGPLYAALGRLHAWHGASSWRDALDWLASVERERAIGEIQFWGHGRWGKALIDGDPLDVRALEETHPHHARLARIRDRLAGPDALWWFRTCETFGRAAGRDFARRWSRFFACRVAGYTFRIGPLQSGLHSLRAGEEPTWPEDEGVPRGPREPGAALWSRPSAPNTISFLTGSIPPGW